MRIEYNPAFLIEYDAEATRAKHLSDQWRYGAYTSAVVISAVSLYLAITVCTAGVANLVAGAYLAAIGFGAKGFTHISYHPAMKKSTAFEHKFTHLDSISKEIASLPSNQRLAIELAADFGPITHITLFRPAIGAYIYWKKQFENTKEFAIETYHDKVQLYDYTEDVVLDAKVKAAFFHYLIAHPTSKLPFPKIEKIDDRVRAHDHGGHDKGPYFAGLDKSVIIANSIFGIASMIETLDQGGGSDES